MYVVLSSFLRYGGCVTMSIKFCRFLHREETKKRSYNNFETQDLRSKQLAQPFPQQQSVRNTHHRPLHVVLQFRDELYAVNEKALKEVLADISLVTDEFPVDELHEGL